MLLKKQDLKKMTKENWTIEIKPKKKWLDIDLKGIWRYRDLYYMYVKRDIVTVYKQTILGPLWFLIQPIFTTVMYMFIFGGLAIYITVSSIYNIGKRDGQRLQIEHIRQLPLHGNDTTQSINPLNRPQYGRSTEE